MAYVYFISDQSGRVKIGSSYDPQARLKQLQTSNPEKLKMLGTIKTDNHKFLEKKLHKQYKRLRLTGEWFALGKELVEQIITDNKRVDISELEHRESGISDLLQVRLHGIFKVPDEKYETYAIVTRCEYSESSYYVTEVATGKGFQHNAQYQIDSVPVYWKRIGKSEVMPF